MNADYDKQTNPRWPYALDDPKVRARKITQMYRQRLEKLNPDAAADCDATASQFGETWMLPHETHIDPTQELTTEQAAQLINVAPKTISNWASLDHPENPHQKLLPRFKKRGRERTYLAQDVLTARAALLRARHPPSG